MKRKELILLENRLRKLLKEDTIKGPDDTKDVEVAPGVELPPEGPSGNIFDNYLDVNLGLESDSILDFNRKLRRPKTKSGADYENFLVSPYDGGVVRYTNPHGVVMYFYAKPDLSKGWPDINGLMGNTSHKALNTFTSQDQWNNFVKRIEEKKKNSFSPKIFNSKTKEIQDYIINNFPQYKDLLGPKPNDGLWGLKTDEAILKIIYDIKNSQSQETKTGTESKIGSETETGTETETEVSTGDKNADSKVKSNVDKTQNLNKEISKDETPKGSEETQQIQIGISNWTG